MLYKAEYTTVTVVIYKAEYTTVAMMKNSFHCPNFHPNISIFKKKRLGFALQSPIICTSLLANMKPICTIKPMLTCSINFGDITHLAFLIHETSENALQD